MVAHIINIGDEILIGQIINTNAAWMASFLNQWGIHVEETQVISDTQHAIRTAVDNALQRADIVLLTGGLGPTKDDITKKVLTEYFETSLEYHAPSFENIVELFKGRKEPDDRYKIQSYMPKAATILINKVGTASGMWLERDKKVLISMPGVPYEMKYLMNNEVLPRLQEQFSLPTILHHTTLTTGKGETDLSTMLEDFEAQLPTHIKLAYLPNTKNALVRLRLSDRGRDRMLLQSQLDSQVASLQDILGQRLIFGEGERLLEEVVGALLKTEGKTVSTAESCTGGFVAHRLTSIAGSSSYFQGSVVAYSNTVKENVLNVPANVIEAEGAVSEATVRAMVKGILNTMKTDYGIATSGIAGPGGGRPDKPVGTIWVAIGHKDYIYTKKLQLSTDRIRNIRWTSTIVLNLLRLMLIKELDGVPTV